MPSSVTEASTCSLTSGTSTPQAPQYAPRAAKARERAARGPHRARRCLAASKSATPAATLTFSDSTAPVSGTANASSQAAGPRPQPLALRAEHEGDPGRQVGPPDGRLGLAVGGPDPELRALDLLQVATKVHDDGDRQVLDGPHGCLAHGGRDPSCVPLRDDDPARAGAFLALRTTAPRLCGSVTWSRQTTSGQFAGGEPVRVGVAVRLAEGDDALVLARAGGVVEPPLRGDLEP